MTTNHDTLVGSAMTRPNPDDLPPIVVGQEYEFYAEMQEAERPAHERMRNYTGQKVTVLHRETSDDDIDDPEASNWYVVRAADGREFTAAEEELNGWDKALGQYFWPDGAFGPKRDMTFLTNEARQAA